MEDFQKLRSALADHSAAVIAEARARAALRNTIAREAFCYTENKRPARKREWLDTVSILESCQKDLNSAREEA